MGFIEVIANRNMTSVKFKIISVLLLATSSAMSRAGPLAHNGVLQDKGYNDTIDLSMYGAMIYGQPDNNTGHLLAAFQTEDNITNPEELGAYLEGDILIPEAYLLDKRNGILTQSSRWPGAIVPFEIKGTFTTQELSILRHAFNEYHAKTCVRFKPRTSERDYISIINSKSGCWSSIGRLGGRQEVNLQSPICLRNYGTAIHELMHALGFFHEQNRYERDDYVQVLKENVKPGMMINFEKSSSKVVYGFGIPYDYASVMHYSPTSFSKNGKITIKALKNTNESKQMGQRNGFSTADVKKINAMYKC